MRSYALLVLIIREPKFKLCFN